MSSTTTTTAVSKKQLQMVNDTIGKYPGDTVVYYDMLESFVTSDLSKKAKLQSNLLVVTRFRVFLFLKGKTLEKELALLLLSEVSGKGGRGVLSFCNPGGLVGASGTYKEVKQVHLVVQSEGVAAVVRSVRESWRRLMVGCPRTKAFKFEFEGLEEPADFDSGYAKGFGAAYEAYANLLSLPVKSEVLNYARVCHEEGSTAFNWNEVPGVDSKTELAFDLLPIAHALKHNTYFQSLSICDIEHKDAITALSIVLSENRHITRVICKNCTSEITEALGQALLNNPHHKVVILDLSGNKFAPKAVESLALAIQQCPHQIDILNLENVGLTTSGMEAIINSLTVNWGLSLGVEEINLSSNNIMGASSSLIQFMSHMRRHTKLKRLSLASTGVAIGSLILELGFLKLTYLDISDNKFDKLTQNNLAHFCEATKTLETLRLANTALSPTVIARMISSLTENEALKNLSIDISRNNLGTQGVSVLVPSLRISSFLALDVSDNGIKEKGAIELLRSIKHVQMLILDRNWREEKDSEELGLTLASFANSHPELTHLSIAGTLPGSKLGRGLKSFFANIADNMFLQELDFSGNGVGDVTFSTFCSSLVTTSLRRIRCDNNQISCEGYMCLKRAAMKCQYLELLDWPIIDFDAAETRTRSKFLEVIVSLMHTTSQRKKTEWMTNPFDFDCNPPTPTTITPLQAVPPELLAISRKLYDGPAPTLPVEEEESPLPPPSLTTSPELPLLTKIPSQSSIPSFDSPLPERYTELTLLPLSLSPSLSPSLSEDIPPLSLESPLSERNLNLSKDNLSPRMLMKLNHSKSSSKQSLSGGGGITKRKRKSKAQENTLAKSESKTDIPRAPSQPSYPEKLQGGAVVEHTFETLPPPPPPTDIPLPPPILSTSSGN